MAGAFALAIFILSVGPLRTPSNSSVYLQLSNYIFSKDNILFEVSRQLQCHLICFYLNKTIMISVEQFQVVSPMHTQLIDR